MIPAPLNHHRRTRLPNVSLDSGMLPVSRKQIPTTGCEGAEHGRVLNLSIDICVFQ